MVHVQTFDILLESSVCIVLWSKDPLNGLAKRSLQVWHILERNLFDISQGAMEHWEILNEECCFVAASAYQ